MHHRLVTLSVASRPVAQCYQPVDFGFNIVSDTGLIGGGVVYQNLSVMSHIKGWYHSHSL